MLYIDMVFDIISKIKGVQPMILFSNSTDIVDALIKPYTLYINAI